MRISTHAHLGRVYISKLSLCQFYTALPRSLFTRSSAAVKQRAAPDNTVYITDTNKFWTAHTAIGDSERPGGMQAYCSPGGRVLRNGTGVSGGRFVQLTGCIRAGSLDRLISADDGGQYDSSGGDRGLGNPQGSVCLGYKHYVELMEPSAARACIRCCDDPADCPTNRDTAGCPDVIPGDYVGCQ
ncbi:hypothetical protein B0H17DRAFT_1158184 [Mycena rosella]|uniref:Uncharacterized protein n=1 Tax=Mycena rosella TaxID=1033263 RepID=A0AAD7DT99_MYCRO|nr:hypothetical protein B0H17DRAFT_1158184 [Mycena rosella]